MKPKHPFGVSGSVKQIVHFLKHKRQYQGNYPVYWIAPYKVIPLWQSKPVRKGLVHQLSFGKGSFHRTHGTMHRVSIYTVIIDGCYPMDWIEIRGVPPKVIGMAGHDVWQAVKDPVNEAYLFKNYWHAFAHAQQWEQQHET